MSDLLYYKDNLWIWNLNKKEFIEYMKNEYCSKNTTKADIKFIKDKGYINIKCNWWFSKEFINFLNKYNCINSKSYRIRKLECEWLDHPIQDQKLERFHLMKKQEIHLFQYQFNILYQ